MRVTTFYRNLRRFNALLPLMALSLMALGLAYGTLFTHTAPPAKSVVTPDAKENGPGDVLVLRKLDVELDLGPQLVMLKVVSQKKSGVEYSRSEIRNLVFVKEDSTDLKWVFPTQKQELDSVHAVKNSNGVVKGIYVEATEKSDAAKNSSQHLRAIHMVSPDGSGYKQILSKVDEVISRRNDANTLQLIYQKDNSVRMAKIDLQHFEITADRELAKLNDLKQ